MFSSNFYPISGYVGDLCLCAAWVSLEPYDLHFSKKFTLQCQTDNHFFPHPHLKGMCLYILSVEAENGYRRGGWIQVFLVLELFLIAFQIKNAISLGQPIGLVFSTFEFIFSFFMTIFGLYWNEATTTLSRLPLAETEEMTPSPERFSSLYSKLTFSWLNPLLEIGIKKPLEDFDLYQIPPHLEAEKVSREFDTIWREELKKPSPKMARALWAFVKVPFLLAGCFKIVHDVLLFAGPYFLKLLVQFVQEENPNPWYFRFSKFKY